MTMIAGGGRLCSVELLLAVKHKECSKHTDTEHQYSKNLSGRMIARRSD